MLCAAITFSNSKFEKKTQIFQYTPDNVKLTFLSGYAVCFVVFAEIPGLKRICVDDVKNDDDDDDEDEPNK